MFNILSFIPKHLFIHFIKFGQTTFIKKRIKNACAMLQYLQEFFINTRKYGEKNK